MSQRRGSGFGKNISNWIDRGKAYPTNVLYVATECGNKNHSAVFPESLPEWFIRLFTTEGDWVLDPFAGSGTTLQVAQKLKRHSIGIEIQQEYHDMICKKVQDKQYYLCEGSQKYEIDES